MKIAVIGAGNMGGAIAAGALREGVVRPEDMAVADPSDKFAGSLAEKGYDITYSPDNRAVVKGADLVVVAVKPWLMEQVLGEISDLLDPDGQAIVSIAAGVSFGRMKEYLGAAGSIAMYRIIPNTAVSLGKSVTFIVSHNSSAEQDADVDGLFAALGSVVKIREEEIPAYTALSSSGIAYAYKYIDAATKGGTEMGIPSGKALEIVIETMKGAIAMLEANGLPPQKEIDKVTTPGGITLKGLEAMEKGGFTQAVIDGLKATKFD